MALTNIPAIWSGQVLSKLRKTLVYAGPAVVNRDYEGEISQKGDTVNIVGVGIPTIFDYTKNTDMPAPETLTDDERQLVIDRSKGFNWQIDDIDRIQTAPNLEVESAANAAYGLADAADQYMAAKFVAEADSRNAVGSSGTPVSIDTTTAYETLVKLAIKLDKQNVPSVGRWVVVPPFFQGVLALDQRFIGDQDAASGVLQNGKVGRAAGFDVYVSNNAPNATGKYSVVAGARSAGTFAEQLVNVEFYRPEARFATAAKGLHVYGGKVVRPNAVAVATVSDGSGLDA